jgi:hypothetical protein
VAWEVTGANEYTVWSTDSNGNYTGNLIGTVSGNSFALESLEPVFQQDLNGDGVIGPTQTVIQTDTNSLGSTSLTEVASQYFYLDGSGGSGPALKYNNANVTVGEFGNWTPIGAVQTASGYDVAWEVTGANEYTVWSTDSNGNYTGNLIGTVSGNSYALESLEPVFQQDLNGDGVIGPPQTVIQTDTNSLGSTSLTEVANLYFYLDGSGGSGPALKYNGANVTVGEFSNWTPVGAVQTASGYDVAWEVTGANQYTVWSTDGNGNYTGNLIGTVSGNSYALETLEPVFQQDLNGDGVIGLYAAPSTTLQIDNALAGTSGATTIGTGATLELAAADSASVTFSGSTGMLKLDSPSTFSGEIFNFTGNGSLSGSDQIDLTNINYNTVQDSYANGVLTVSDGSGDTAKLSFSGSYALANFDFASDGSSGTIVYDPPVLPSSGQNTTSSGPGVTPAIVGTGATLELAAGDSESVTFAGSKGTLILDGLASGAQPFKFAGTVSGFGGQDAIDLPGIAFDAQTTLGYAPNSDQPEGTLSLSDGIHTANLTLLGNYMAASFATASDSHGGTMIIAQAATPSNQALLSNPHHA